MARRDTNSLNSVTDSSRPSRRASTFRGRNSGFRSRSRPVLWDVRWTFWQRFAPLYPSHTRAATVLRPYCDQFFDQIALDCSKVSLRSHYGLSVVAVGRTSRYDTIRYVYCDIAARRLDWDNQKCNKII